MKIYNPEGKISVVTNGYSVKTLEKCMQSGIVIEAPVSRCDSDLTLYFDLGTNVIGIMPFSEFEYNTLGKDAKPAAVVNKVATYTCFKVMSIEQGEDGKSIAHLSRKEAQKECYDEYISKLQLGQVISARITHVEPYGAFCDIGCGIISLLPIENFCVTKLKDVNIREALRGYKDIKVIVRGFDKVGRIILSHKELLGTWEQEAAKFKPGDVVMGTVRMVESYGVFVELTPNLVGLAETFEGVKAGDIVSVLVKNIIPSKMKVKLAIQNLATSVRPIVNPDYRIPEDGFVKHWVYSPEGTAKKFETIIGDEAEGTDSTDADVEADAE